VGCAVVLDSDGEPLRLSFGQEHSRQVVRMVAESWGVRHRAPGTESG